MMAATRYDHGGAQGRWHWTAPRPEGAMGWVAYAATALAIAWVLHWSAGGAQMSWGELARGMPQIADFLSRSVPPDWSILPRLWAPALETVQIAVWGTLLSVLLALPLSFIAAGNLHGWHWLRRATRQFLNVVRSINELILALVFVSAVGLGPFPGVLALALHGMGMLGKFFAESIEEIDDGPLQALRSAGATPGVTNPFLHLSMHLSISEQCSIDQPRGIRQAVELLSRRLDSLHDAHHATMECLGQMLWESQRSGRPPDGEAYIAAVQRRATSDGAKATGGA
jgi:ABC-type amino acid transport system permease subunit